MSSGDEDWETDPDYVSDKSDRGKIGSGEKIPASQVAALGEALAAASSAPEPVAEQHDTSSSVPAAQLEGTGTARGLSRPLTDAERAQLLLSGLFVDDIDEAIQEDPSCLEAFRTSTDPPEQALAEFRAAVYRIMYSDPAEARTECGVDEEDAHC